MLAHLLVYAKFMQPSVALFFLPNLKGMHQGNRPGLFFFIPSTFKVLSDSRTFKKQNKQTKTTEVSDTGPKFPRSSIKLCQQRHIEML